MSASSFSRIVDENMTGGVVSVSIGKESFGSFSVRDTLVTADGGVSMTDSKDAINWVQTMDLGALCAVPQ